jgi:virulence factor Mce-like protein
MRITWKQVANFVVVLVVGIVATGWAVIELADVRLFHDPKHVEVHLARSGGALPGAEVTYLGVSIGRVTDAELTDEALVLRLEIDPRGEMARELRADVRQKTSLGEPYVDLAPASPGAPAGDPDGAVVPVERTSTPETLDVLFRAGERLLDGIDPEHLGAVAEGMSGLVGHEGDLRDILSAGAELGQVVAERQAELGRIFASSAELAAVFDEHQEALRAALAGGADLGEVLAARQAELRSILSNGAQLGAEGSELLRRSERALDGTLAGLDATLHTLASRPTKVHEILIYTPRFVTEIGKTFQEHAAWSSTQGVPGIPFSPSYGLPLTGSNLRIDKILLPSIAQRIVLDGSGFPAIKLVSPEEAYAASLSPEAYREAQRRIEAELQSRGPSATP